MKQKQDLKVGGNTSTTYYDRRTGHFMKEKKVSGFNINTLTFQEFMRIAMNEHDTHVKINRILNVEIKTLPETLYQYYKIHMENIDEASIGVDALDYYGIGKFMALFHMVAKSYDDQIVLPSKTHEFERGLKSGYQIWMPMIDSLQTGFAKEQAKRSLEMRENYFNVDFVEGKKVACHRDFKPHNILTDHNDDVHLIDFDFAAKDYPTLEMMSFFIDIYNEEDENHSAADFLAGYYKNTDIMSSKVFESALDNYIKYLAWNCFPFYMESKISNEDLATLIAHRNRSFERLTKNYDDIKEMLVKIS